MTRSSRIPVAQILTIGLLPSLIKKLIYRLLGYKLGRKVHIGFGSVVCGEDVVIGDSTRIEFLTIIRGKQIRIGSHVKISSLTFLDTPIIEIGDDARINEQVFVGGLQEPDSRFTLGNRSQIFQLSYINPAKSIVIGDDTGIGGHSLIFGHASWLSELDGYPVSFEPIEIGNQVALAWRTFVLPGTKIGDGVVVAADSLVKQTIPPRTLVAGFPARVVGKAPFFPRQVSDAEREALFRRIVQDMIGYLEKSGIACTQEGLILNVHQQRSFLGVKTTHVWRLLTFYHQQQSGILPPTVKAFQFDVLLSLREVPTSLRHLLTTNGTMWIDVERRQRTVFGNDLGEEVVQYLRRFGIRLARVSP